MLFLDGMSTVGSAATLLASSEIGLGALQLGIAILLS